MSATDRAAELLRLHTDPELLVLVNVWDVASARVVAAQPGCKALATASAAIAVSFGYPGGEHISLDRVLDMTARIVEATDLPVTADLEADYGDVAATVTRAIAAGVVDTNLEVDGATHAARAAADRSRDRRLEDAGIADVDHLDAESASDPAEAAQFVDRFVERLAG